MFYKETYNMTEFWNKENSQMSFKLSIWNLIGSPKKNFGTNFLKFCHTGGRKRAQEIIFFTKKI